MRTSYLGHITFAVLTLVTSAAAAGGKIAPIKANTGDISLKPIDSLAEKGQPSLINGIPVSPKAFPSSFYQESDVGSCTATLVGRKVLITAAHCVGNGAKVTITLKPGSIREGKCTHHKDYKDETGDISADYALCLLKTVAPRDRLPETLTLGKPRLVAKALVLLAGYGCTKRDATGGGDGVFRVGLSAVENKLGTVDFGTEQAKLPMPNYFTTRSNPAAGGGAVICPGDSGGAVYQLLDKTSAGSVNPTGRRIVIGVNSRYGIGEDELADGRSILSATRAKAFVEFIEAWTKKNNVKVCGVNELPSKCRKI